MPYLQWLSMVCCFMVHSNNDRSSSRLKPFVFLWCFCCLLLVLAACNFQENTAGDGSTRAASSPPVNSTVEEVEATATVAEAPIENSLPTAPSRRLRAGELTLAADIDAIPAIFAEDDLFVDAEDGSEEWVDEEIIIGVTINEDARAYPIRLLSNHEIVNDTIGGQPVAVTWCPLCFTAIVFDRVVEEQELTFGVSGYLYYNNLVMYDHRTNTLWSQAVAEAIRGAYNGKQLEVLPSQMTSWGEWKAAYPETLILSAERLGTRAEDVIDPYSGYYTSGSAGVTGWANPNDLMPAKELVVGLAIGEEARAYPLALVREEGLIQDELGGIPLLLVYDPGLGSVAVYRRETGQGALNFVPVGEGWMKDEETNTIWDVRDGRAAKGAMAGDKLSRLAAPLVYWFAWSDIYSNSDVYENIP